VLPQLKGPQFLLWILLVLSLPFRAYTNYIALAALLSGVFRKHGMPKISKEFMRRCIFVEDFQIIGFMAVGSMGNGSGLIVMTPVLMHGLITCA
jgi:hypothetical protein